VVVEADEIGRAQARLARDELHQFDAAADEAGGGVADPRALGAKIATPSTRAGVIRASTLAVTRGSF